MSTCKDCLHIEVCKDSLGNTKHYDNVIAAGNVEELCAFFKDRSKFVELPCKVGDTVYMLVTRKTKAFEVKSKNGEMKKEINHHTFIKKTCFTKSNLFDVIERFGKTAFLTKEEAEKALAERSENK